MSDYRPLVKATLKNLEGQTGGNIPFSPEAVNIVLMVIAHESNNGQHRRQINGPALGVGQMEPATYTDIFANYVVYRDWLRGAMQHYVDLNDLDAEDLVMDDVLMTVMIRLQFFRYPEAIPKTPSEQAALCKKRYNGPGKATADKYLQDYLRHYS